MFRDHENLRRRQGQQEVSRIPRHHVHPYHPIAPTTSRSDLSIWLWIQSIAKRILFRSSQGMLYTYHGFHSVVVASNRPDLRVAMFRRRPPEDGLPTIRCVRVEEVWRKQGRQVSLPLLEEGGLTFNDTRAKAGEDRE